MTTATEAEDRESVRRLLKKINDAWVNGRAEELGAYFHKDMVIVAPGFQGTEKGRDACVNSYDMDGASYRESGWDTFVFNRSGGQWLAVWRTLVVSP